MVVMIIFKTQWAPDIFIGNMWYINHINDDGNDNIYKYILILFRQYFSVHFGTGNKLHNICEKSKLCRD